MNTVARIVTQLRESGTLNSEQLRWLVERGFVGADNAGPQQQAAEIHAEDETASVSDLERLERAMIGHALPPPEAITPDGICRRIEDRWERWEQHLGAFVQLACEFELDATARTAPDVILNASEVRLSEVLYTKCTETTFYSSLWKALTFDLYRNVIERRDHGPAAEAYRIVIGGDDAAAVNDGLRILEHREQIAWLIYFRAARARLIRLVGALHVAHRAEMEGVLLYDFHPVGFWLHTILTSARAYQQDATAARTSDGYVVPLLELVGLRCMQTPVYGLSHTNLYGFSRRSLACFLATEENFIVLNPNSQEHFQQVAERFDDISGPLRSLYNFPEYRGMEVIASDTSGNFIAWDAETCELHSIPLTGYTGLLDTSIGKGGMHVTPDCSAIVVGHNQELGIGMPPRHWKEVCVWEERKEAGPSWVVDCTRGPINGWMVDATGRYLMIARGQWPGGENTGMMFEFWLLRTGELVQVLPWTGSPFRQFTIDTDPFFVAGGTLDGVFFVLNPKTGCTLHQERITRPGTRFNYIECLPGSGLVFVLLSSRRADGSTYEFLRIFNLRTLRWLHLNDHRTRVSPHGLLPAGQHSVYEYALPCPDASHEIFFHPSRRCFAVDPNSSDEKGPAPTVLFDLAPINFTLPARIPVQYPVDPVLWRTVWGIAIETGQPEVISFFLHLLRHTAAFGESLV